MKIVRLSENDSLLEEAVIPLWRRNSATLGLFPEGAFRDRARDGCILVALDQDRFFGYLIFRVASAKRRCTVVQLCVSEDARGSGVARNLVEFLRQDLPEGVDFIKVKCRRDFEANHVWPRLGFSPVGEEKAKAEGKWLNIWHQYLGREHLFSRIEREDIAASTAVAIDAQIFFDLESEGRPREDLSKDLIARWQASEWMTGDGDIKVFVTDEIYKEIERGNDDDERRRLKRAVSKYHRVPEAEGATERVYRQLEGAVGAPRTERDRSDLMHIARAAAGNVFIFATYDSRLTDKISDSIYRASGVSTIHPLELESRLAELEEEQVYRPARLRGTSLAEGNFRPDDLPEVLDELLMPAGEKRRVFQNELREYLAFPERYRTKVVRSENGMVVGLIVIELISADEWEIKLLRAAKGSIYFTLIRCLIDQVVIDAATERVEIVSAKPTLMPAIANQLTDAGFIFCDGVWFKVNCFECFSSDAVAERLGQIARKAQHIRGCVEIISSQVTGGGARPASVERLVWPGKILYSGMMNYIVPIQPRWARDLFDSDLADQFLFGADMILALSHENVYYKSAKYSIDCPSRILWYVSQGSGRDRGTMSLRACSLVKDVQVGPAKELYKRFRRLGVYRWKDIKDMTGGDAEKNIMALHFDRTEMFASPVHLNVFKGMINNHPLASPCKVSDDIFVDLYMRGKMTSVDDE